MDFAELKNSRELWPVGRDESAKRRCEGGKECCSAGGKEIHQQKVVRRRGRKFEEGTLVAATAIMNEIFVPGRAGCEPFEVCDVFQAEARLLLGIDFNISFRDIQKWVDIVATRIMQWDREGRPDWRQWSI